MKHVPFFLFQERLACRTPLSDLLLDKGISIVFGSCFALFRYLERLSVPFSFFFLYYFGVLFRVVSVSSKAFGAFFLFHLCISVSCFGVVSVYTFVSDLISRCFAVAPGGWSLSVRR